MISQACQKNLKLPLLTSVHELNHWSLEKMVTFMNPFWWGIIRRPRKAFLLLVLPALNSTKGSLLTPSTNSSSGPFKAGKWISNGRPSPDGCIDCNLNTLVKRAAARSSAAFGIHKLILFEITVGQPMHLAPASFDLQLIKGHILQVCRDLN